MKKIFSLVVLCIALFSGCASILSGTKQIVKIDSNVKDAQILLDGVVIGKTPFAKEIKKKKNTVLTIKKEGYNEQELVLETELESAFWLNILSGGTYGSSTDSTTGGMWKYAPDSYMVNLKPIAMSKVDEVQFIKESQIRFFVTMNYDRLMTDIARGNGKYLSTLHTVFKTKKAYNESKLISSLKNEIRNNIDIPGFADFIVKEYNVL